MSERYASVRIPPVELSLHPFDPDRSQGVDFRNQATHCTCGFPRGHRRHDERAISAAAAAVDEAQAEERRRLGEAD
ncbi:hypothetical protein ACQPZJ_01625 [Actinoplanes sp. CA-054009]